MTKVSRRNETAARLLRGSRFFVRDERGAIAVMFALMLAALLAVMALAVDLGKAWNLDTELQHAADAAALAGATQLDGKTDARKRAIQAITSSLARNVQHFSYDPTIDQDGDGLPDGMEVKFDTTGLGDGEAVEDNIDVTFYEKLEDPDTGDPAILATSDATAHYVEVHVRPREVDFSFAAVVGAVSSASPDARATAFYGAAFCEVPPLFTCAPVDENGKAQLNEIQQMIGVGMWLKGKDKPGATSLFPGNFGLLCLTDENGNEICSAQDISDGLARANPLATCFARDDDLETKTGEVTGPVQNGLNMRLGIYPNGNHKVPTGEPPVESNPQYGRTENPVKGVRKTGGNCKQNSFSLPNIGNRFPGPLKPGATMDPDGYNYDDYFSIDYGGNGNNTIEAMSPPRDNCAYEPPFNKGASCRPAAEGGRFGIDGSWDIRTYMKIVHNFDIPVGFTPENYDWTTNLGIECSRCDPAYTGVGPSYPRRWEVFLWERDTPNIVDGTFQSQESPADWDSCGVELPDTPDRRVVPVAVVDCEQVGTGKETVIAGSVVLLYLTEAVGFGPEQDNKNIYGEIIGEADLGKLTTIERNIVELVK